MSNFLSDLKNFITDKNIEYVKNTGNVLREIFVVRFGDLEFREKDFIGTNVNLSTIFNSIFNRDLNLHNEEKLADKIRYAIEIIAGPAEIGFLPMSYIVDLALSKQGGIFHIHQKDRGHTGFILANVFYLVPLKVWVRVIEMLDEQECRGSERLQSIRDEIQKKIESKVEKFSIADILTKENMEHLNNIKVPISVSIETIKNHRIEIIKSNNSGNRWSTHSYGQILLQEYLCQEDEPVLDIDDVYNTVKKQDVFLAKKPFLAGFKSTIDRHAAHEDEILMFYKGCRLLQSVRSKEKNDRYKFFEKTEDIKLRQDMFRLIYEQNVTTRELQELAKMWEKVASTPRWDSLKNRISKICRELEKHGYEGSTKNITDLDPHFPRAALRWFDMVNDLQTELKWGSDIVALTNLIITTALDNLLQYDASTDPLNNNTISALVKHTTGRSTRETYFYTKLHTLMIEKFKNKDARESKSQKLLELRDHLYENGFEKRRFDVIDRTRAGSYVITRVDLLEGRGFELGHKIAGAEFTDENTFLQFPNDNKFNSAHNIGAGYWIEYGSWVLEMKKKYSDVDEEAFENTLTFCEIMADKLI